jgi:hypothetical protein
LHSSREEWRVIIRVNFCSTQYDYKDNKANVEYGDDHIE